MSSSWIRKALDFKQNCSRLISIGKVKLPFIRTEHNALLCAWLMCVTLNVAQCFVIITGVKPEVSKR